MEGSASPPVRLLTSSRVRVLVVDDNDGFRESLVSLLHGAALVVVGEAGSGKEALELVLKVDPDVVLMDVRMPAMDGVEATKRLKTLRPSIGVVALSGYEDQHTVRDMLVAGASGYVLKDSDGEEILNAVLQAAAGGGVISPGVTPTVIEELTEALQRERRRIRQLEIAQAALLERAARRHELVSRLGHELRTPVTVILGMAQVLQKGTVDEDQRRQMLDALVGRASALARLVERFEVAVEAGLTEWADVTGVAHEVAGAYPRVVVEAPRGPAMATLNRAAARRILEELVENALAFSQEPEPVTIRVSLDGDAPHVRVIDHGGGVAEADVERIFDPLQQGEDLNTRTHPGAGFGLALARMSARAMEGDVALESTGPEGSTFIWTVTKAP